jgi:hypothetical protein
MEAARLLDALRLGELRAGARAEAMPWKNRLPLALTVSIRDNQQGRDSLDEVAAHIAPALSARVRFETGTSENLSNLMRRLTKQSPHADSEPCPMTFHYTRSAVPVAQGARARSIDLASLLPIADATLRALRQGDGVTRALDVDIARHLVLVAVPCNDWDDVRQVEAYVRERLEFARSRDRSSIGVLFSCYTPDGANREEPLFAIRLGAVAGGWDAVYRSINSAQQVIRQFPRDRVNGGIHSHVVESLP